MTDDARHNGLNIAITGMGGIFPKAPDMETFWDLILNGKHASRKVPSYRWPVDPQHIYDPGEAVRDRARSTRACLLDPLDFNPHIYNLNADVLKGLDPLFHLTLMAGHSAWNDQTGTRPDTGKTGVILGNIVLPTESLSSMVRNLAEPAIHELITGDVPQDIVDSTLHKLNCFPAGLPAALLARSLNLTGGWQTLDAACASSLYALKIAINELQSGRLDAVISGGLGRPDSMYTQMGFSQLRAISPSGICAPFDKTADGLVIGEGAGIVVLRRLSDAIEAGNKIYGVIQGIGLSNDTGGSLFAPDTHGQVRAISQAYDHAGWNPGDIDLIECHGTGTPVGDAVEFTSMSTVWNNSGTHPSGRCVIGSIKSNVGHLLTGAGGAGLIKILLAMKNQTLPPMANVTEPAAGIPLQNSPFRILREAEKWTTRSEGTPRRAAVSAFGFGGINAHVLVEEYREKQVSSESRPIEVNSPHGKSGHAIAVVGLSAAAGNTTEMVDFQRSLFGLEPASDTNSNRNDTPLYQSEWFRKNVVNPSNTRLSAIAPTYIPIGRFRIPPAELREMLPQQLLMLKVSGDALEQSSWRDDLSLESGVFIGIGLDLNTTNFQLRWSLEQSVENQGNIDMTDAVMDAWSPALTANRTMGALGGIVASRIARAFKVGGMGFTVSSEDSSGVKALETAVRMLQNGDIRQAIVGAVDLATDWRSIYRKTSDTHAMEHGFPDVSDGAVAMVLKPLVDAEADGDTVLAVLEDIGALEQDHDIAEFPQEPVIENLGWTGAASGLFTVAAAVIGLHHRLLPGQTSIGPEYWLRNREEGPRRTVVKLNDTSPHSVFPENTESLISVVLSEHTESADRPLRLPSMTPALKSFFGDRFKHKKQNSQRVSGKNTAFVYPGSGSHRPRQGRKLSVAFRHIMDQLDSNSHRLKDQFQPDLYWNQADRSVMDLNPHGLIVGHVAYCFFLTELMRHANLVPGSIIGYSLGESTGLIAQRIWPDRDAVLQKLESTNLFTDALGGPCTALLSEWDLPPGVYPDWQMSIINISGDKALELLDGWPRLYLLIRNLHDQCVIGGHGNDLIRFLHDHKLTMSSVPVTGVTVAHVPAVHEVAEDYLALHYWPVHNPDDIDVYSGAWSKPYTVTSENCSEAILAHATTGIDFPATIENANTNGITNFVEIGPGNGCSRLISKILSGRSHTTRWIETDDNPLSAFVSFLETLEEDGWPVDIESLLNERSSQWSTSTDPVKEGIACHSVWHQPPFPRITKTAEAQTTPSPFTTSKPLPSGDGQFQNALPDITGETASIRLSQQLNRTTISVNQAQSEYIKLSQRWTESMQKLIEFQTNLFATPSTSSQSPDLFPNPQTLTPNPQTLTPNPQTLTPTPAFMDRNQCMEFAIGSIAAVLGPAYAEADTFPTRVRLPDEPLMLVDRILTVEGEAKSMTHGRVVTEHDVLPGSWYLDQGRCPVCISVEAGQADLFLSGYLGIDFETRGIQRYRLLDAEITMHRGLPIVGETIRYDIRITRFFKQGGIWLFMFEYDATINNQPMLTMRNGCAGFFSDTDLEQGQGIVKPRIESPQPRKGDSPGDHIFVKTTSETFDSNKLQALRHGDLAGCFGEDFRGLDLKKPPILPGGKMHLIDRIVQLDPTGGPFGLGQVTAEADIDPEAWFLTCHFVDDMVMPGTLMYECCFHAFRVLLMRIGWVGEADTFAWDTRPGVVSKLKCRGQVIKSTKMASYQITVKEIGFDPAPYAITDALMFADSRPVVEIQNMSVQLNGLTRDTIAAVWADKFESLITPGILPAVYRKETIMAFSNGNPSDAFGDRYRIFDDDSPRTIARLPGPPYQFMDRVVQVTTLLWDMKAGGTVVAEYDVPDTEWYYDANGVSGMPFSVLLEIALQPCGWYSAYMGSALQSDEDLSYRNLGGTGIIYRLPQPGSGPIAIAVDSTQVSKSGGMIIQNFNFRVYDADGDIYVGDTYFGFFTKTALADQVGIREDSLYSDFVSQESRPFPVDARLPGNPLCMMDVVSVLEPQGGPDGLGFIEGRKMIQPDEWFFKAHFYEDPVWPGSLGLEAMLQLMQAFAIDRWGDTVKQFEFTDTKHTWVYRGQVIPADKEVTVQAIITGVDDNSRTLCARGYLSVDGRLIYSMKNFEIRC